MERQLDNAQRTLEFATTEYSETCTTLHASSGTTSNETAENCDTFIGLTREELLKVGHTLKTAQNQQAYINRLPPELLVSIFQFELDTHKPFIKPNASSQICLSRIVSLSGVCSHWRKLVVETSSFWSYIPLPHSENLVALCVERAKKRPLDIVAINTAHEKMIPSDGTWKGENPLRDHSHCIRSLTVSAYDIEWIYSPVTWVLESNIPWNLQELSVVHNERGWHPHAPLSTSTRPTIRLDALAKGLYALSLNGVYIHWSECTFDNLCVLQLTRLRFLRLNEFEQVLASSPALQVLEIRNTSLRGKRTSSKPLSVPNLKTLRVSYMKTGLEIIADMFEPGDYNVELDVSWVNAVTPPQIRSKTRWLQEMQIVAHKMRNITLWGFGDHACVLEEKYLLSVMIDLPNFITLRLQDLALGHNPLLVLDKTLRALPQTKKIQMRHVSIPDVETFKDVIGRCSVERIELINCWVYRNGKRVWIERGTTLYEWALTSGSRASLLWE